MANAADSSSPKPPGARARLVQAAARLFQERGFAATGLSEILTAAEAPKGSMYHHFPGGKADLGAAAMQAAGAGMIRSIAVSRETSDSAAGAVRIYGEQLATWLEQSGFTRGCPVATVALEETPGDGPVAIAAREALMNTQNALADMLDEDGIAAPRAQTLAAHALAAIEGALILARISSTAKPVRSAADEVAALIEREPRV